MDALCFLVDQAPDVPALQRRLALVYNNLSRLLAGSNITKSETFTRKALRLQNQLVDHWPENLNYQSDLALCLNNWATFCWHHGDVSEARDAYQQAIRLQQKLVRVAPAVLEHQRELAISYNSLGRLSFERTQSLMGQFAANLTSGSSTARSRYEASDVYSVPSPRAADLAMINLASIGHSGPTVRRRRPWKAVVHCTITRKLGTTDTCL